MPLATYRILLQIGFGHPWYCWSSLDHRPNSNLAVLTFKHYTSSTDEGLHHIHET